MRNLPNPIITLSEEGSKNLKKVMSGELKSNLSKEELGEILTTGQSLRDGMKNQKKNTTSVPRFVEAGHLKVQNRIYFEIKNLETDRLELLSPEIAMAEDIFEYASNDEVTKYLTWQTHKTLDDTVSFLNWAKKENGGRENAIWMIKSKENGKIIGSIGIHNHGNEHEIGFWLGKPYWGKGIMSEALTAVDKFAESKGIGKLVGKHMVDNIGSGKVFIKNGYEKNDKTEKTKHKDGSEVEVVIYEKFFN